MKRSGLSLCIVAILALGACSQPFAERPAGEQALIVGGGALVAITLLHGIVFAQGIDEALQ